MFSSWDFYNSEIMRLIAKEVKFLVLGILLLLLSNFKCFCVIEILTKGGVVTVTVNLKLNISFAKELRQVIENTTERIMVIVKVTPSVRSS